MARTGLLCCLLALLIASVAQAQWSSDPTVNLPVADDTGDQVQPKVAPRSDGGCYVSWYDNSTGGYDVRLQRLDVNGIEAFAHNGILIADRSFSSTQDYGLDIDASGNALLVFRDDRLTGTQITASKVSPTGTLIWGAGGVQLTNTTAFVAAPKIAGTADGGVVVAWTEDSDVHLQKLAGDGSQVWGADVVLVPSVGSYSASDLHDSGNDVILAMVHVTGGFTAPKHLVAQKFDATGAALWGASPVAVFDGGSLQFGNYPTFVPDGGGGAVFSWYDTAAPELQVYAQHIRPDGSEAFPHNGSPGSTVLSRGRVGPAVDYRPLTDETFLFWVEQNSAQSAWGLYGQKFDGTGTLQWTTAGTVIVPIGSDQITQVRCHNDEDGALVFWMKPSGATPDRLYGARTNGGGGIDIGPFDVSSTPSDKSRLASGRSTAGFVILAWQDPRSGAQDIYAQNVNPDGSLGPPWAGVAEPASLLVGAPRPNPTAGVTRFECSIPGATAAVLEIYDVRGRGVRKETIDVATGGMVAWDGRDDRGELVPSGVYFMRVGNGATAREMKVTVLR